MGWQTSSRRDSLPPDWPGTEAQALFRRLYTALSPLAEAHVARVLEGENGPLPGTTARTQARLRALA